MSKQFETNNNSYRNNIVAWSLAVLWRWSCFTAKDQINESWTCSERNSGLAISVVLFHHFHCQGPNQRVIHELSFRTRFRIYLFRIDAVKSGVNARANWAASFNLNSAAGLGSCASVSVFGCVDCCWFVSSVLLRKSKQFKFNLCDNVEK